MTVTQRIAAVSLALVVIGGCASPAKWEAMTIGEPLPVKPIGATVSVDTGGGAETDAGGVANVSDADFKAAIENSIAKTNLFKSVVQGKGGDYELYVVISETRKPFWGTSMTVDMEAGWSLVKAADRSVVMRKVIKSSHTTGPFESFLAATRLRMALEGAAQSNIEQGLGAIAELGL
jgi:hypothetical protein